MISNPEFLGILEVKYIDMWVWAVRYGGCYHSSATELSFNESQMSSFFNFDMKL